MQGFNARGPAKRAQLRSQRKPGPNSAIRQETPAKSLNSFQKYPPGRKIKVNYSLYPGTANKTLNLNLFQIESPFAIKTVRNHPHSRFIPPFSVSTRRGYRLSPPPPLMRVFTCKLGARIAIPEYQAPCKRTKSAARGAGEQISIFESRLEKTAAEDPRRSPEGWISPAEPAFSISARPSRRCVRPAGVSLR